ncbi:fimbrial protein [Pantoea sp. LS15]|uniref:fimbrial protein n=1 Tax=Enterobacterales TaxID=91347 RepID=UPI000E0F6649|nr:MULTISPECIES: fimbrial protein [Enterobacterales]NJQ21813.1 fimbrial protein [Pantoea sp. LS15]NKF48409.1 fimbrial protein [Pantoea sp. LS15]RDK12967.1 hypothetical protein CEJ32_20035 [Enterobacter sp. 9-2]
MRKSLILLSLLAAPMLTQAATTVNVSVKGTLHMPTTCDLGSAAVQVEFDDILTDKINGTNYVKPVPITLTCSNRNPLQSVYVRINAPAGTAADRIPINGTAKGFELQLKRNNVSQSLNTNIKMDADGDLKLTLTPVNVTAVPYVTGAFTAAATVVVSIV